MVAGELTFIDPGTYAANRLGICANEESGIMGGETDAVARMLIDEHQRGARFRPFAAAMGITNLHRAYEVQRSYVRLQMRDRCTTAVGYKVGLTSRRMQAMCKIDRPVAGVVLGDRVYQSGTVVEARDYGRLGLEFELAVRLGRDLRGDGAVDLVGVVEAVDSIAPAVEIVDDRDCDYATLDVLSLVADNSWNAGAVLGAWSVPLANLETLAGVMSVDGKAQDRGSGRDVLGHPYNSVGWVAQHLAGTNDKLRAGDIVMTGNWVTTKFPAASSTYRFDVQGLGAVELSVHN
jgi:2-keto-4-pentenoate hydratase